MPFVHHHFDRLLASALVLGAALTSCGVPPPDGTESPATAAPTERTETTVTTVARRAFVAPDCSVPSDPPPPASADRIGPLLAIGGRTYWARGAQLPLASAGGVVGRTCRLDEGGTVELLDDDSPYPAGTELRAITGYDPRFRLGIVDGDRLVVFELFYDGGARTGADLYDLPSGVDAVEIRTFDSDDLITTWTDERVRTIVSAIDAATIDRRPTDGIFAYRLRFRMHDGCPVDAVFNPRNGRLQDLQLGPDVAALFADLPRPPTSMLPTD